MVVETSKGVSKSKRLKNKLSVDESSNNTRQHLDPSPSSPQFDEYGRTRIEEEDAKWII
jgi:hypothetical protein